MTAAFSPNGCAAQSLQGRIDIFLCDDGEQFAFVRDIERIEPENFARAFYFLV